MGTVTRAMPTVDSGPVADPQARHVIDNLTQRLYRPVTATERVAKICHTTGDRPSPWQ